MGKLKVKLEEIQKRALEIWGAISQQRWIDILFLILYIVFIFCAAMIIDVQDKRMDALEKQIDSMEKINGCIRLNDEIVEKYFS